MYQPMTKTLVGILTCHRLDYYFDELTTDWLMGKRCLNQEDRVETQRATWIARLPEGVDYQFFYGTRLRVQGKPNSRITVDPKPLRQPKSDETFLPCGDNYTQNSHKLKEMCRWALDKGYDYLLRVDDDTYVDAALLTRDFIGHDYSGPGVDGGMHPGGCLFLSRKAMEIIVAAPVTNYADDVWIAGLLKDAGVKVHQIKTIWNKFGEDYQVNPETMDVTRYDAFHSCTPKVMRELWIKKTPSLPLPTVIVGTSFETSPTVSPAQGSLADASSSLETLPPFQEQNSSD